MIRALLLSLLLATPLAAQTAGPQVTGGPAPAEAPLIDLGPAPLPQPPDPAAVPRPEITAAPPPRDGQSPIAPSSATALMPIYTQDPNLPRDIRVGASQPDETTLRLTGEYAQISMGLDLPQGAPASGDLRLMLRSSINVLNDVAQLVVSVNGGAPQTLPLSQIGDFAQFTLPVSGLVGGTNHLDLTFIQPHRIFCGPEATFGLWTEINLAASGLNLPDYQPDITPTGFALALRQQLASGQPVPILVDASQNGELVRSLTARLWQAMAGRGRVEIRSFYALGRPPSASVALIASDRAAASLQRSASGGVVLKIEYTEETLPDLSEVLPDFGQAERRPALIPGTLQSLRDLGESDILARTHYFRQDVSFEMPPNWLLLANQKARLDLRYGFAKGLSQGAILLVKVNDTTVRLLPLDKMGGDLQPLLPIGFNANLLHPGRNLLSFEMMIPGDPADQSCPIRRSDLLVILADSTLTIPPSPEMALQGLSERLSTLGGSGLIPAEGSVDAAGLADFALRLGAEFHATDRFDPEVSLRLLSLGDLALLPSEELDVSPQRLQSVLYNPQLTSAEPEATAAAPARFNLANDDDSLPPEAQNIDFGESLQAFWARYNPVSWLRAKAAALNRSAFLGTRESLDSWLRTRNGVALIVQPSLDSPKDLWLITSHGLAPETLGQRLEELRQARLAHGRAALLDAEGHWQVWSPIAPPYLREPLTWGNVLTVLGNYASWSPILFTTGLLFLALISILPALAYVLLTRKDRRT